MYNRLKFDNEKDEILLKMLTAMNDMNSIEMSVLERFGFSFDLALSILLTIGSKNIEILKYMKSSRFLKSDKCEKSIREYLEAINKLTIDLSVNLKRSSELDNLKDIPTHKV